MPRTAYIFSAVQECVALPPTGAISTPINNAMHQPAKLGIRSGFGLAVVAANSSSNGHFIRNLVESGSRASR
jgi:hypothetical protein